MNNVPAAFVSVPMRPRAVTIDRKGIVLPKGGHFQGIQRVSSARPERLVISSSSETLAYCLLCDINGNTGRAHPPLTLGQYPMKHAGGCQSTPQGILAIGVEDDKARNRSEIQFWNLSNPRPSQYTALTIARSGLEKVTSAGAVGMAAYGNRGGALLAVGTWDCDTVDFYTSPADPFTTKGARWKLLKTWEKSGADKSDWIDQNFGAYQNLNVITQRDGAIFLVGFHRSEDDDWMDLYTLNLSAPPAAMLRKIDKKHMYCTDGCSFRDGAGVYIASASKFEVYAVKGLSGDHETGTTIHVNRF